MKYRVPMVLALFFNLAAVTLALDYKPIELASAYEHDRWGTVPKDIIREFRTAAWADRYQRVWIIVGPVVYGGTPRSWLGEEGEVPVAIPDAFYKLVIRDGEEPSRPEVLAFLYPQFGIGYKQSGGYDHTPYLTSVDTLEALTGLDFLTSLPDDEEALIERLAATQIWQ